MKKLSLIIFLIMSVSACQLTEDPKSDIYIRSEFPLEFQGYYTKISGGTIYDELQEEFKISEKYMTYKDKTVSQDNTFLTYIIEQVHDDTDTSFTFSIASAYENDYDPIGFYQFEKIAGQPTQIRVTYCTISIIFPTSATAIYKKTPLY